MSEYQKLLDKAAQVILNAHHTTAFTGAGISVESGIPPFRGKDGLWSRYDPNCLDLDAFYRNPEKSWKLINEIFYDFFGKAHPNPGHESLAILEKMGYLHAVITQNIDNLHRLAGNKQVIEFHGTSGRLKCTQCHQTVIYQPEYLSTLPPQCKQCGGILKPDFIFFGEAIPLDAYHDAMHEAKTADVFLVIGTTGEVYPASTIPWQAKTHGAVMIEINPESSSYTHSMTDIYLKGKAGEMLPALVETIKNHVSSEH
ncbi:MAG: NAD-dependent deacylase [Candidatus Marinimicrobia bacterium]|nr:NAD-dependent deacylase [Candidatus Neomarinimicrobiota bacterium]MDD5583317.1 NAD-dependent deacylase [Candidatus Neomarinimicrobiota bacterium]